MSYILEALKKSERERQAGQVPTIATNHDLTADDLDDEGLSKKLLKPGLIVSLLLINTLVVIWLVSDRLQDRGAASSTPQVMASADQALVSANAESVVQANEQPQAPMKKVERAVQATDPAASITQKLESVGEDTELSQQQRLAREKRLSGGDAFQTKSARQKEPESDNLKTTAPIIPNATSAPVASSGSNQLDQPIEPAETLVQSADTSMVSVRDAEPPFPAGFNEPAVSTKPQSGTSASSDASDSGAPLLDEEISSYDWNNLPVMEDLETISTNMPVLEFSSHLYSTLPRYRSVVLNGRHLREGQRLDRSIEVAEITEQGVVLLFDGEAFRLSMEQ